jgi:hypothetical protein
MNSDIIYIVALAKIQQSSYFDVNAHLGYKYNSQLTGFLERIISQIMAIKNG